MQIIKDDFAYEFNLEIFTEEQLNRMYHLYCEYMMDIVADPLTFVFAGFGKNQIYPSMIELVLHDYVDGKLYYEIINEKKIDHTDEHDIEYIQLNNFQAIESFISELSEETKQGYLNVFKTYLLEKVEEKEEQLSKEKIRLLHKNIDKIIMNIDQRIVNLIEQVEATNVSSLSLISIEDLVIFAENMIKMAIVHSEYSFIKGFQGSSGGKIQSAAITAIDGFVWSKQPNKIGGIL
jgi:hypothetical protein